MPCTGWEGILAGTPYEGVPLESVTLAEVLTNNSVGDRLRCGRPRSSRPRIKPAQLDPTQLYRARGNATQLHCAAGSNERSLERADCVVQRADLARLQLLKLRDQ